MDNQPSIDRGLLIPILISGFSIVGIIVVLFIGRSLNSPEEIPMTPSATSFQYLYLGTEPAITTLVVEGSELPATEPPATEAPILTVTTRPAVATPIILTRPNTTRTATSITFRTGTPSRLPTATSTTGTRVAANTYDDTDSRLAYTGTWDGQTNVNGAYQGTLHISSVAGSNSITFTFTGHQLHFFYQAASSYGVVTIKIDNDALVIPVNEAQGGEWVSDLLAQGTHTVVITHASGGSVNIDKLVIPAPTPTPTRTPTSTQ